MRLLQTVQLVLQVAILAQQRHELLGLVISNVLDLVQGRDKASMGLGQLTFKVLKLLQLSQHISILSGEPSLGSLKVSQMEVGLLHLLVEVIEAVEQVPIGLLSGGLGPVDLICGGSHVSNLSQDLDLVLLDPEENILQRHVMKSYGLT